jgi:DNA polymerase I
MMKNKYKALFENITNTTTETSDINSRVLLVDGMNLFLRSHTAINLINSQGHHIGGLTGFLKSLGYAIKTLSPTRVIICFEGVNSSSNRKNLFPAYKGNRNTNRTINYKLYDDKDDEKESIENQMNRLKDYLKLLPLNVITIDNLEADDIIGEIVLNQELPPNGKFIIMSADQDFLQLVSDKVEVFSPTKKKLYNKDLVQSEFNVLAHNFIYYKVLLGDTSDNIPGIRGIGPKKILKWFPELNSKKIKDLDEIYEICKDNNYDNIIGHKKQLDINFKLMSLKSLRISEFNMNVIDKEFNALPPLLNKNIFLALYYEDLLDNAIPGVEYWLTKTFGTFNFYK